jgi:hypothetical protein
MKRAVLVLFYAAAEQWHCSTPSCTAKSHLEWQFELRMLS